MNVFENGRLMFSQESINQTKDPILKVLRTIFFMENITDCEFLKRHLCKIKKMYPNLSEFHSIVAAAEDHRTAMSSDSLSSDRFEWIVEAMGFEILEKVVSGPIVTVRLKAPEGDITTYTSS